VQKQLAKLVRLYRRQGLYSNPSPNKENTMLIQGNLSDLYF